MRLLKLVILSATFVSATASADTYVNGYYRKNGTYVQPHYRSDTNSTRSDNWSTKGNVNPYTGAYGTKNPYGSGSSYNNNSYGNSNNSNSTNWND
ncbi:hypothetical protein [Bdellovibrio bacteriovorus]|uniref:hypothetical protein n=1 Tax=Bdellovibrio bacteriovorus TaxID=959 RepID=UPI00190FBA16|nr:hypothetical protein [Bdellovibrio bacteriovorus]